MQYSRTEKVGGGGGHGRSGGKKLLLPGGVTRGRLKSIPWGN